MPEWPRRQHGLLCPLLTSAPGSGCLRPPQSRRRDTARPPEVSSTAFTAHPPDLQPPPLMDEDFAITRSLVRPVLPRIRFLFVGSRLCSTLPSDHASRRRPCASLALHLHQVVQGTFTPKLSNMLGTRLRRLAKIDCPFRPVSCYSPVHAEPTHSGRRSEVHHSQTAPR